MSSHKVVLVGALDTKGDEYAFVRDYLNESGVSTLIVDTSVLGSPAFEPDVTNTEVAEAGGAVLADLREQADRGKAMDRMAQGAQKIVAQLQLDGTIDGALALGGTGGTSLAADVFRALPLGVPKLILSTAASGNTEQYIRETDLILMPSVVDIAGLNRISTKLLANAAAAMVGMVGARQPEVAADRPMIAASMFGVTTSCVTRARARLEALGYEVLVFHMTGSGGRAMESLIEQGFFTGVLDVTTTELCDELVGGVFSAGPNRLTAAAAAGIPQVVSTGALDMVNWGAIESVAPKFKDRVLHVHNSSVTLMRTTPEESAALGAELAHKLAHSRGPTIVALPLRGVSAISVEGGPFHDTAADESLFTAIRSGLKNSEVTLIEIDSDINDEAFADRIADELHGAINRTYH